MKLTGCAPGNWLHVGSPTHSASTEGRGTRKERVEVWGSEEAGQPKAGKDNERTGLIVDAVYSRE